MWATELTTRTGGKTTVCQFPIVETSEPTLGSTGRGEAFKNRTFRGKWSATVEMDLRITNNRGSRVRPRARAPVLLLFGIGRNWRLSFRNDFAPVCVFFHSRYTRTTVRNPQPDWVFSYLLNYGIVNVALNIKVWFTVAVQVNYVPFIKQLFTSRPIINFMVPKRYQYYP